MRKIVFFPFFFLIVRAYAQPYFQQEVNYKIDVKLDDIKHELTAFETVEYINNSHDELSYIYFHLWPNAYKNGQTALAKQLLDNGKTDFYFSKEEDKGFIDQLDFRINNQSALLIVDPQTIDIGKVILNERLKPGEKVTITTPFRVKIPNAKFSRLGHDKQQYQISQWYPKPAVYDNTGWHPMSYLDQGEFYSEFGSFDVAITLPKNYVVGATGNLQDEDEKQWLEAKVMETIAYEKFPATDSFPTSDSQTKTIHYKQDKVHDFAWFCDKRYHVLKSEIELPNTHRQVTTWALFTNHQAHLWKDATKYVNDALYYYSLWNGDYPYDVCTVVDGAINAGGGMEYPTITVINSPENSFRLDNIIAHEVGHNWFYGILGSNERLYAWMDEGINTYNENRYMKTKYPYITLLGDIIVKHDVFDLSRYSHNYEGYFAYLLSASQNTDEPCQQSSEKFTELNYGGEVYAKTGLGFEYLQAYLGDEVMDKCMRNYFDSWQFKHPQPNDLRKIMEDVSGKNLSWFFDDYLRTTHKIDYKIVSFRQLDNGSYDIVLKNVGKVKSPVSICGIVDGKMRAQVWYDGFEGMQTVGFPSGKFDYFKIDFQEYMPEINRNNNSMRTKGMLKKVEPIKLQLYTSLDNPDKTQLFIAPVIAWNDYNKFMLGAVVHNMTIIEKNLEYAFVPFYSIASNTIAGYADVHTNFHPNNLFQKITIGVKAARFAYSENPFFMNFNKISPQVEFTFRNKTSRSTVKNSLLIKSNTVFLDTYSADYAFSPPIYFSGSTDYTINQLIFKRENKRTINPSSLNLELQQSKDFIKTSVEAKYEVSFKGKNKSIDFRFFAGVFIDNSGTNAGLYRFRTSGWTGYQDYLFDNIFLGRTETSGILSQQFVERDGAFKTHTFIGQTQNWITALNIKSSLPGILPIRLYADIGVTANDARLNDALLYDAGIDLSIVKNIFEVYFPLVLCPDFKTTLETNNVKYSERIRFTLNINLMNPINFIRNWKL